MGEVGYVIEAGGGTATVKMTRSSACGSCTACKMGKNGEMILKVKNLCEANEGDSVLIEMKKRVFGAALIAYGIPCLLFIAGAAFGCYLTDALGFAGYAEIIGFLMALALTFLSYTVIRKNERRFKNSGYTPEATQKL